MQQELTSQQITASSGSNLALSFFCLPREVAEGMSIFYAFCRVADDIVDAQPLDVEKGRAEIQFWRDEIGRAYRQTAESPLGQELGEIARRFSIPKHLFYEILDGVEMDLTPRRYKNFEELRQYCYRVASAVGLVSIRIFGCQKALSEKYAVDLGLAFQLTNILRDVRQDLREFGRVYLPQDEMTACGVTEGDLDTDQPSEKVLSLFRLQHFRATHYFNRARRQIDPEDRKALAAALIMTEVYSGILEKIGERGFRIPAAPLKLSKPVKIWRVLKGWAKSRWGGCEKTTLPKRIAVWGAGFSGIAAALYAAREGDVPELFESKAFVGGRAHSYREAKMGKVLDNGQHIFMGCYHETMKFLDLLGCREKLEMQPGLELEFRSASKGATFLRAGNLPSPFHMLSGLWGYDELSLGDKFSALKLGVLLRLGGLPKPDETGLQWMQRCGQTQGIIRALWEPFCIAAVNLSLKECSAELLHRVMKQALFGTKEDAAIYLSTVGLSDLLMPEAGMYVRSVGGAVHVGEGVSKIEFSDHSVKSFTTSKNHTLVFDRYISALPWHALEALVPGLSQLHNETSSLKSAPILGVHLWMERSLECSKIVGFLDSPLHWLFDRSHIGHQEENGASHYTAVISGADEWNDRTTQEILDTVLTEIQKNIPKAKSMLVIHSVVYKSRAATFRATPAAETCRPGVQSEWENLLLAGDWTNTKLPATLEGAVLSGHRAAVAASS